MRLRSIPPQHSDVWRCSPRASVARRKIERTAEFVADLSKMRDADKAETLVEDERPRIICVHTGYDRMLLKGSLPDTCVSDRSARMKCHVVAGRASRALSPESNHRRAWISARINPGQKNGAFNKFDDVREAGTQMSDHELERYHEACSRPCCITMMRAEPRRLWRGSSLMVFDVR